MLMAQGTNTGKVTRSRWASRGQQTGSINNFWGKRTQTQTQSWSGLGVLGSPRELICLLSLLLLQCPVGQHHALPLGPQDPLSGQ